MEGHVASSVCGMRLLGGAPCTSPLVEAGPVPTCPAPGTPFPWDPLPLGPPIGVLLTSLHATPVLEKGPVASLPWPLRLSPWLPASLWLPWWWWLPSFLRGRLAARTRYSGGEAQCSLWEASSARGWGQRRGLAVCRSVGPSAGGAEQARPRLPRWSTTSSPSWASTCSAVSSWLLETAGEVGPERAKGSASGGAEECEAGWWWGRAPRGGGLLVPPLSPLPPHAARCPHLESVPTAFLKPPQRRSPHPRTPFGTFRPGRSAGGVCPEPDLGPAVWKLRFPCVSGALGSWLLS